MKQVEINPQRETKTSAGKVKRGKATFLNNVRRVIAVINGKGGVGKSLVSGLLAVALRQAKYQVGLLDADITGPGVPKMFFPDGAQSCSHSSS